MELVPLPVLRFSTATIIQPLLHAHLSPLGVCHSPDQAAHYHILGPKLGASSLTRSRSKATLVTVVSVSSLPINNRFSPAINEHKEW
jgi:hypothetical protein